MSNRSGHYKTNFRGTESYLSLNRRRSMRRLFLSPDERRRLEVVKAQTVAAKDAFNICQ